MKLHILAILLLSTQVFSLKELSLSIHNYDFGGFAQTSTSISGIPAYSCDYATNLRYIAQFNTCNSLHDANHRAGGLMCVKSLIRLREFAHCGEKCEGKNVAAWYYGGFHPCNHSSPSNPQNRFDCVELYKIAFPGCDKTPWPAMPTSMEVCPHDKKSRYFTALTSCGNTHKTSPEFLACVKSQIAGFQGCNTTCGIDDAKAAYDLYRLACIKYVAVNKHMEQCLYGWRLAFPVCTKQSTDEKYMKTTFPWPALRKLEFPDPELKNVCTPELEVRYKAGYLKCKGQTYINDGMMICHQAFREYFKSCNKLCGKWEIAELNYATKTSCLHYKRTGVNQWACYNLYINTFPGCLGMKPLEGHDLLLPWPPSEFSKLRPDQGYVAPPIVYGCPKKRKDVYTHKILRCNQGLKRMDFLNCLQAAFDE